jgi:hypothetical protein
LPRTLHLTIFGLVAVMAVSVSACGGDSDEPTTGQGASTVTGDADAPAPTRAFGGLRTALEAQGLDVEELPKASLDGAEDGVSISGDRAGSARLFATEADAKAYADEVAMQRDKATVVGTVVFQATTQDDAEFFADADEG